MFKIESENLKKQWLNVLQKVINRTQIKLKLPLLKHTIKLNENCSISKETAYVFFL